MGFHTNGEETWLRRTCFLESRIGCHVSVERRLLCLGSLEAFEAELASEASEDLGLRFGQVQASPTGGSFQEERQPAGPPGGQRPRGACPASSSEGFLCKIWVDETPLGPHRKYCLGAVRGLGKGEVEGSRMGSQRKTGSGGKQNKRRGLEVNED